jgi:hypothetical protein
MSDTLPPVPAGFTPEQRAFLEALKKKLAEIASKLKEK